MWEDNGAPTSADGDEVLLGELGDGAGGDVVLGGEFVDGGHVWRVFSSTSGPAIVHTVLVVIGR